MRLPDNKANLNKVKLHTDTNMHTYTDTDSARITSESTEAGPQEKLEPSLHLIQWEVGIQTIRSRTKKGLLT